MYTDIIVELWNDHTLLFLAAAVVILLVLAKVLYWDLGRHE